MGTVCGLYETKRAFITSRRTHKKRDKNTLLAGFEPVTYWVLTWYFDSDVFGRPGAFGVGQFAAVQPGRLHWLNHGGEHERVEGAFHGCVLDWLLGPGILPGSNWNRSYLTLGTWLLMDAVEGVYEGLEGGFARCRWAEWEGWVTVVGGLQIFMEGRERDGRFHSV